MSDKPTTAQQALEALRQRAAEHDASKHEADREYAAGIRDAITALEPFLKDVSPDVVAYLYGTALLHPDDAPVGEPDCEPLGRIQLVVKAPSKVTKLQQDVLDLLKAGWELGVTRRLVERRVWLQKDGLGKGGETRKIRLAVFDALVADKRIVRGESSDQATL